MKLIILDRDGVINEDSDKFIKSPDEWHPITGSLEAIAKLNHFGYRVAVATNQSGLARGLFSIDDLNAIHQKLHKALDLIGGQLECIVFCPHGPNEGCYCRKPNPGLLLQIKERIGSDLEHVPVIGDSMRDIISARHVGGYPILVKTGKGRRTLKQHSSELTDVPVLPNLAAAVESILDINSKR